MALHRKRYAHQVQFTWTVQYENEDTDVTVDASVEPTDHSTGMGASAELESVRTTWGREILPHLSALDEEILLDVAVDESTRQAESAHEDAAERRWEFANDR